MPGEGRWGTDETAFNVILCARSYPELRAIFAEYQKICRYTITQSIDRELSGDLKTGMLAIGLLSLCSISCLNVAAKCVEDKAVYFAEQLHKSMKGLGTDDKLLSRIIVSRCEASTARVYVQLILIPNR